jgi:TatD DNase family protein
MNYLPLSTDYIDIHSHNSDGGENIFRIYNFLTTEYPFIPENKLISVGLHPWHISEEAEDQLKDIFNTILDSKYLLAIGETGIDKVIKTSVEKQVKVFRKHIELSKLSGKPLIIHCVKAYQELFAIKREYPDSPPWIIHGFNAGGQVAAECVKNGIYISLSRRLFVNPDKAREISGVVPLSMIFAETDEDDTPIHEIYRTTSLLYNLSISELKEVFYQNFRKVFSGGNSQDKTSSGKTRAQILEQD